MKPRVNTHERVRQLEPCEQREYQRGIERRKDARAIAVGYLANSSIRLDGDNLTPSDRRAHAREIVALADAMRKELESDGVVDGPS